MKGHTFVDRHNFCGCNMSRLPHLCRVQQPTLNPLLFFPLNSAGYTTRRARMQREEETEISYTRYLDRERKSEITKMASCKTGIPQVVLKYNIVSSRTSD